MDSDSREKAKILEALMLKTAQKHIKQFTNQLQSLVVVTILNCPTIECFEKKGKILEQIHKQGRTILTFLQTNLQQCISRQSNYQGIEGYSKCFNMFQRVIAYELNGNFMKDTKIRKGYNQSQSKRTSDSFKKMFSPSLQQQSKV